MRVLDRLGSGRGSWFGLTRSNRVDSVKPGQHSELTRSTQPTFFSTSRREDFVKN
ncbi:hypothetical protein Hanom_Chr07g00624871 [Helianthus anomalus]